MARTTEIGEFCSPDIFHRIRNSLAECRGMVLFLHDAKGECVYGECGLSPENCLLAMNESLRWGETAIQFDSGKGTLFWSVPVMLNNEVLGGMGAGGMFLEEHAAESTLQEIREAAENLLQVMIRENLVNLSSMEIARAHFILEQEKAEAIHLVKKDFYRSIQSLYTDEEPALLNAIRRGDRAEATAILNRIFVVIYNYGSSSQDLLKSYLLELVAMMSRAAVEAGGIPEGALGLNFGAITRLAELEDDEAISNWLNEILNRLFAEIQQNRDSPHSLALNKAFAYMQAHLSENLKRETIARHAGLSSSHFAHLLSLHTGKSFREILTELRVEKAAGMLYQGHASLAEIALECGFSDQSHFSRVFRKATRKPPGEYRKHPQGLQFRQ